MKVYEVRLWIFPPKIQRSMMGVVVHYRAVLGFQERSVIRIWLAFFMALRVIILEDINGGALVLKLYIVVDLLNH